VTDAEPASAARPEPEPAPEPAGDPAAGRATRRRRRPGRAGLAGALTALVAFVPRALSTGHFQTTDEVLWMNRSRRFTDALLTWEPTQASASVGEVATMPGVTTMWAGTAARGVWALGGVLGLHDGEWSVHDPTAIHLSQLAVAVATSLLIGLLVALVWRWAGPIPAVAGGVLLATEPFLVAHGAVLHTDELAALCGAVGTIAVLLALRRAAAGNGRPWSLAVLGGAGLAGAFLSKLSGLTIGPGLALVVVGVLGGVALQARRDGRAVAGALQRPVAVGAVAAVAAVATVVVAWPAAWADPMGQYELLTQSAGLVDAGHLQFFLGDISHHPGPWFYAVTTPMRMTPWFLVASVVLVPLALLSKRWTAHVLTLVVVSVPAVVIFSVSAKQFDRYLLVVFPFLAIAVGAGLDVVVRPIGRLVGRRVLAASGGVAALALAAHAVVVAPWGLAYFNPLLGGTEVAERNVLIGWGEGLERAGAIIAAREEPRCDVTIAVMYPRIERAFPCGTTVRTTEAEDPDYLVLYISERQRLRNAVVADLRAAGELVDEVRIAGVDYAEVYDLRLAEGAWRRP
jgi:hypothetical protein